MRWDKQNALRGSRLAHIPDVGLAGLLRGIGRRPFVPARESSSGSAPVFNPLMPPGVDRFDPKALRKLQPEHSESPTNRINSRRPLCTGSQARATRWCAADSSIATIREGIGFLGWRAGAAIRDAACATSVDRQQLPQHLRTGRQRLLAADPYPTRAAYQFDRSELPQSQSFPLAVQSGQSVEDYNPSIKPEYVESWTFGFQRQLEHEYRDSSVRYVGNPRRGSLVARSI